MILCFLDDLRSPDDAPAGIVSADDRHQHAVLEADVFESPEYPGRNVEYVAFFKHDFAGSAPAAPKKSPAALENKKDFCGPMRMKRIPASRGLARSANIKSGRLAYVDVLLCAFRNAAPDDRKVLLQVRPRRMRVDERGPAGHQLSVADDPLSHFFRRHGFASPSCNFEFSKSDRVAAIKYFPISVSKPRPRRKG